MRAEPVTTTHAGTLITYDERSDTWAFELRGREHAEQSLKTARAVIDKPAPKVKADFERVECWHIEHPGHTPDAVTATSIAMQPTWRAKSLAYWVRTARGHREKVDGVALFPINEESNKKISAYNFIRTQIEALEKRQETILAELPTLPLK